MELPDHIKDAPRKKPDAGVSHLAIVIEFVHQSHESYPTKLNPMNRRDYFNIADGEASMWNIARWIIRRTQVGGGAPALYLASRYQVALALADWA